MQVETENIGRETFFSIPFSILYKNNKGLIYFEGLASIFPELKSFTDLNQFQAEQISYMKNQNVNLGVYGAY